MARSQWKREVSYQGCQMGERGKQDLAGEWSLEQVMVSKKRRARMLRHSAREYAPGCTARQRTRAGWSTVEGSRHARAPSESSMACTGSTRFHPEPAPLRAVKPSSSRQACPAPVPGSGLPRACLCLQPTPAPLLQQSLSDCTGLTWYCHSRSLQFQDTQLLMVQLFKILPFRNITVPAAF